MADSREDEYYKKLKDELKRTEPFDSLAEELTLSLMLTNKIVIGAMDRKFKEKNISGAQIEALRGINEFGDKGLNIQMISDRMASKHPDVTRIVDRLEKAGYAERGRSEKDRRVVTVRITAEGKQKLKEVLKEIYEIHKTQFKHMTEDEMRDAMKTLAKLRSNALD